jgi:hypothetical protein
MKEFDFDVLYQDCWLLNKRGKRERGEKVFMD